MNSLLLTSFLPLFFMVKYGYTYCYMQPLLNGEQGDATKPQGRKFLCMRGYLRLISFISFTHYYQNDPYVHNV